MAQHQFNSFNPFQRNQDDRSQDLLSNRDSVAEQGMKPLVALDKSTPSALDTLEEDTLPLATAHGNNHSQHNVSKIQEEDTIPLATAHGNPVIPHKRDNLSTAVQHVISTGLARLQDPQPEGLYTRGLQAVKQQTTLGT